MKINSVEPLSNKGSWKQFDNVDFALDFEGEKLVANSVRLSGEVRFYSDSAESELQDTSVLMYDAKTGMHGLFRQFTVELQNKGVISSLQNPARLVRMKTDATMNTRDLFSSEGVCELRAPRDEMTRIMMQGLGNVADAGNNQPDNFVSNHFYLKPLVPLNECEGNMSYRQSGQIKISVQMETNLNFFYGESFDTTDPPEYVVSNLKLHYMTIPDDGKMENIIMRNHHHVKQNLDSANSSLSVKVPAICDAMSSSFIQVSHEGNAFYNNLQTEVVPDFQEVQFLINDAVTYIDFPINDRVELFDNYVSSLGNSNYGNNDVLPYQVDLNNCFGIGLHWNKPVDFSVNKFNMNLKSGISNAANYDIFMYFHSYIAM